MADLCTLKAFSYRGAFCAVLLVYASSAHAAVLPGSQRAKPTKATKQAEADRPVKRLVYANQQDYLVVEVDRDDLVHFEAGRLPLPQQESIWTSPMIASSDFSGPTEFSESGNGFFTKELTVSVDRANLCARVEDRLRSKLVGTFCPRGLEQTWKQISFDTPTTEAAYGLGQYFHDPASEDATNGNWIGRVWDPLPDSMGNMLRGFSGGANDFSVFPILYGWGSDQTNYGVFFDQVYKQMWDFRSRPFTVGAWGDQLRWFVFTGDSLPELRRKYMDLVGKPPVPPMSAFGLWVSEFGFENWQEIDHELAGLKSSGFPIDGFCLDLQWFGGTFGDPDHTGMGSLTFDQSRFPNPAEKIAAYKNQHHINLALIEEPYISERLVEHGALGSRGYLARDCEDCGPTRLSHNPWWGYGGMMDYTNSEGARFWHDFRRQKLYDLGIRVHWLDLGEPEQYNQHAWYAGFPELNKHGHADIHNIYNFRWIESIYEGYQRNHNAERPFILSRSGTSGVQRYGAALWSGDIGTDWNNLRAQLNTQSQMSLSGIDYYGSDIGGFQRSRGNVEGGTESLYTQWFAHSTLFDVPVRPHAWNLDKARPTSPSERGDEASNLANIKRRYEMLPYYYSLAYRASLYGEPLFPPAFYYFEHDGSLRGRTDLKMIGKDLVAVTSAGHFTLTRDFRLPEGLWYDFQTGEPFSGAEETLNYPMRRAGVFQLPLFARAGAIIPVAEGLSYAHETSGALHLKVFAGEAGQVSQFTLFEDDGISTANTNGGFRQTLIHQSNTDLGTTVTVDPGIGQFQGMASSRLVRFELYRGEARLQDMTLNGAVLPECQDNNAESICFRFSENPYQVTVQAGRHGSGERLQLHATYRNTEDVLGWAHFVCDDGETQPGTSVYVIGSDEKLGAWDPNRALLLAPSAYPRWESSVTGLEAGRSYDWKCIKKIESSAQVQEWEGGANHQFTARPGFSGSFSGSFRDR